jgi:hypothetical protein
VSWNLGRKVITFTLSGEEVFLMKKTLLSVFAVAALFVATGANAAMTNLGVAADAVFTGHVITEPTGGFRGLYAPSEADDPTFRGQLGTATGGTWDYADTRVTTPSVSFLSGYDCVLVWANYAFLDPVGYGNNLADYVDGGGSVVLGAFCAYTIGNFLSGRIMLDAAYAPVTGGFNKFVFNNWSGDYAAECVHAGVSGYGATYRDILTLRSGASLMGTFLDGNIAQARNAANNVGYANGAGGFPIDGAGPQWAQVVANHCNCTDGSATESSTWGQIKGLYR